jgi:hypothetical protein
MAVVRCQVPVQVGQVEETVDLAQQVILRHYIIQVEGVKEGFLRLIVAAHHGSRLHPSFDAPIISLIDYQAEFFNRIGQKRS